MLDFIFCNPVKLFFGEDKRSDVISEIEKYGSRIMLVMGGSSFKANGYYQSLVDALEKDGIIHIEFSGIKSPVLLSTAK